MWMGNFILTVSLPASVSLAETMFDEGMVGGRPESMTLDSLDGRYIGIY